MSTALEVEACPLSVEGGKRPRNEDYVDFHQPGDPLELARSGRLYLVADGVGGAAHGERASQYAVQKVLYDFYQASDPDLGERLRSAVCAANADLYQYAERTDASQPLGTTLVAALLHGLELVVANVGDSRAYLIRDGRIQQISRDHSLVQRLIDEEGLTPEAALTFPRKNVILRSVGADEFVEVDVFHCEAQPGDTLLLCTDGLHKYFPDQNEIARVAGAAPAAQAAQALVELANERGGSDNISVLIVRLLAPPPAPAVAAIPPVAPPPQPLPLPIDLIEVARTLTIGGRPLSSPQAAVLMAGLGLLIVVLFGLGYALGRQLFS